MTEKQKIFADEYLIDLNATRAYKVAYPNVKKDETASAAGSRMLGNVKVKSYIGEQLRKLHDERSATANEVIEYLTSVMRGESNAEEIVTVGIGDGCVKLSSANDFSVLPIVEEHVLGTSKACHRLFALVKAGCRE